MTIDVIRLAREANIDLEHHVSIGREPVWIATQDELERFAALVMEECSKVCDDEAMHYETQAQEALEDGELDDANVMRSMSWQIKVCAAAIRARKPA